MNLFGLESISEEDREAIARRSLDNLLTSYADEADIFTELIQNAFDAIIKAKEDGLLEGEDAQITIIIGRRTTGHHYIYVADNGIGMSPQVAENLTVPGYSHGKKKGKTVGYKGVGASYFFAASQKAALKTIDANGTETYYTVRGSYEWVKNTEEPPPTIDETCDVPNYVKAFLPNSRGTGVLFQFHEGMRPKNLNGIVIIGDGPDIEIKNWLSFLSSKTALGSVDDISGLGVVINVHLDLGEEQHVQKWKLGEYDRDNHIIGYPFPHRVFRVAKNAVEIDVTPQHMAAQHSRRYQAIHKRWTADEIIDDTSTLEREEIDKLREYLVWVEGYFCYSTEVLQEVNRRLGGRANLVRYGIKIACDGIPQGRNIDLSLTSSQGLDRQTHIVMSFKGLELDTGRKISADEVIASAIKKLGQRIVGVLKEYRWAMKKKDRPDITTDLETWMNSIEERSQTSLVRELYEAKELQPVFSVDPDNESEVISLFVSLLAHEQIKGYIVKAISGYARYDSLISIDCTSDSVRNVNDVLSVRNVNDSLGGDNKVLEFKYNFEDLLVDFDEKKKNPVEIDFCVCWMVPTVNVSRGRIEPTYGDWKDHRQLYGASYIWVDENDATEIPIIALKNLLAELLASHEADEGNPGIGQGTLRIIQQGDQEAMV